MCLRKQLLKIFLSDESKQAAASSKVMGMDAGLNEVGTKSFSFAKVRLLSFEEHVLQEEKSQESERFSPLLKNPTTKNYSG